ncbi:MAG: hypothetical protein JWP57_1537 [Spirosoma sp.]|nr:hypothetical protein [Spirosoma sp.]
MENWKWIAGHESSYEVSDQGRIMSHKQGKPILLALSPDKQGYLHMGLYKEGRQRFFYVHRLVAAAFIENPDNKKEVNHKSGNKADNSIQNLEWATRTENYNHALEIGIMPKALHRKLPDESIKLIRAEYEKGQTTRRALAIRFGVNKEVIRRIVIYKSFSSL